MWKNDELRRKQYHSVVFLPKTNSINLIMRKHLTHPTEEEPRKKPDLFISQIDQSRCSCYYPAEPQISHNAMAILSSSRLCSGPQGAGSLPIRLPIEWKPPFSCSNAMEFKDGQGHCHCKGLLRWHCSLGQCVFTIPVCQSMWQMAKGMEGFQWRCQGICSVNERKSRAYMTVM